MRTLYLFTIILSNLVTARYNPFILWDGILIVPAGSIFAGAVFVLRDLVQMKHGKQNTYKMILAAVILSGCMSVAMGDTSHIAAASAVAFIASESIDTEIFSRMKKSLMARIILSGIVGGIVDSALFVLFGMSPLGANMIPWGKVPSAVLGQVMAKAVAQMLILPLTMVGTLFHNMKKQKITNEKGKK